MSGESLARRKFTDIHTNIISKTVMRTKGSAATFILLLIAAFLDDQVFRCLLYKATSEGELSLQIRPMAMHLIMCTRGREWMDIFFQAFEQDSVVSYPVWTRSPGLDLSRTLLETKGSMALSVVHNAEWPMVRSHCR